MKTKAKTKKLRRPKPANNLVGLGQSEMEQQDSFLASLSRIAVTQSAPAPSKTRKSRFWFKIDPVGEYVRESKKQLKPKELEHVDKDVEERLTTYRGELPPALNSNIKAVREFFLKEIAPLTMASSGGAMQSREVASRLLETEIDSAIFGRFENMVNRAAVIKMGLFVLDYFKLPADHYQALIGAQPAQGQAGSGSNLEAEVKKIMQQLQDAPTRKDISGLSNAVSRLAKQIGSP